MPPIHCEKQLFSLDAGVHYLNCAYMSPLLHSAEQAGISGLLRKRNPQNIQASDFFNEAIELRSLFAQLIHAPANRIALIPSVSYGMGILMQNARFGKGGTVVTVQEEFPSGVYALQRLCAEQHLRLISVAPPEGLKQRGRIWNERLLEAITADTVLVQLSSVHWSDGTRFDLEAIGKKAKAGGALFVVDGTQSVGALPFNVQAAGVDALFCAGYKWLLGPYTSGFAYLGDYFNEGKPLEESWLNREGSEDFRTLAGYESRYRAGAARYNMGEYSNFINIPMQKAALQQILEWTPERIQQYCRQLTAPLLQDLQDMGYWVEDENYRAAHLFGIRLAGHQTIEHLEQRLIANKVVVSLRGNSVRVAPHVYNESADMDALMKSLKKV